MQTFMFLCLLVKNLHESTKTCMFPCIFSIQCHAHLFPPLHHNGNGLLLLYLETHHMGKGGLHVIALVYVY